KRFPLTSLSVALRPHSPTVAKAQVSWALLKHLTSLHVRRPSLWFATCSWVCLWSRDGTDDGTIDGAQGVEGEAARHVCRRRRALSPDHRGRGIVGVSLHAQRTRAGDGAGAARAVWLIRSPREGAGCTQAAA